MKERGNDEFHLLKPPSLPAPTRKGGKQREAASASGPREISLPAPVPCPLTPGLPAGKVKVGVPQTM